jgi:protein-L-isoaspartate(D-aspartate) O-methyltransferase
MNFSAARHNMVESQLRPNRVTDEDLLAAFGSVPREMFVPAPLAGVAYVDDDIEIAPGRWLMEPMILGRLLQAVALRHEDVALVIGCGSGYACAVMARLVNTVVAVESDGALTATATRLLGELAIDNVVVLEGKLTEGHSPQAPYDVILIDGGVEEVPSAIQQQLAEGGRLVTVVRSGAVGRATLMTRRTGVVSGRVLFDAAVPPLPAFALAPGFVF